LLVTLFGYSFITWTSTLLAPRVAFVAAPVIAVSSAAMWRDQRLGRWISVIVLVTFIATDMWLLTKVTALPSEPFWLQW
jgi:hypothetical protein